MILWVFVSRYFITKTERQHGIRVAPQVRATWTLIYRRIWLSPHPNQLNICQSLPQPLRVYLNKCSNNCHHHVADVLNRINYQGHSNWSQVSVWWMCIRDSKYVKPIDVLKVYLPFLIFVAFLVFIFMTLNRIKLWLSVKLFFYNILILFYTTGK